MNTNDLSAIITTFKSEDKIFSCLDSLPKDIRIFVVENSNNEMFKKEIEKKYVNAECILLGKNEGYSKSNNIGLSKVKSKYALVLNPDTVVEENTIENFLSSASENPDFWLMGPAKDQGEKIEITKNQITEVETLKGFAIFFNMEKFKDNEFFDENYFLYFEEIDLCRKVYNRKGKIYLDPKIKIFHEGGKSTDEKYSFEIEKNRNWHWMWSTFYYHKKHNNFFYAFAIVFPKLFSALLKTFLYSLTLNRKKRSIYYCRLSGLTNSILGKNSWYRPSLD